MTELIVITLTHKPPQNLSDRIFGSGAALIGARFLSRIFDLLRMLTIARWLGPAEMGVYAVATLVLTVLDQFSETGLRMALIQRQGGIDRYILPVRTVQALRGVFLGIFVYLTAPWIASFFDSPKSIDILRVIALLPVIRGLEPLFGTLAQRELLFRPVVMLQISSTLISLIVGITAAYYRPDAWALVWAALSAAVVRTVGAHILSDSKSLWFTTDWKSLRDLRNFGFWIFFTSIISYLFIKGGDWMIGYLLDVKSLALYQMAFFTCTLANSEIGSVVSQLSYPVYSQMQHDRLMLQKVFRQSFSLISIITLTIAGLVCSCSPDFYRLVLGEKWLPALPLVPWLTVWGVCSMFASSIAKLFHALGRPKIWAQTVLVMTILMAVGIYPMARWLGALGVAVLLACIGIFMQIIRYRIIARMLNIRTKSIFSHVMVPAISCILSSVLTIYIRNQAGIVSPLAGLVFSCAFFLALYFIFLWLGHPWIDPPLPELLNRIRNLYRQRDNAQVAVSEANL